MIHSKNLSFLARRITIMRLVACLAFVLPGALGGMVAHATCDTPVHCRVTSATDTSAVLAWQAVGGASGYQVIYKPAHDEMASWQSASASTNSRTLTGLSSSTLYKFQVRANCSGVFSSYSDVAYFSTGPYLTPEHPALGFASATSASVFWVPVAGAVSYEVGYRIQGTLTWTVDDASIPIYQLTELDVNENYEVRIRSEFSGPNYSDYTQTVVFSTGPCNAPDSLHVASVEATEVNLGWISNPLALSYDLRYRQYGLSEWTTISPTSNSANITGLSTSTMYQYEVRSKCDTSSVYSSWSSTSIFSTGSCSAPDNLAVSDALYSTAATSWNSSANAQNYQVIYQVNSASEWDTLTASVNERDLADLEPATTYRVRVRAYCGSGVYSAATGDQLFVTRTCAVPDDVETDSVAHGFARVVWTDAATPDAAEYEVIYRFQGADDWETRVVDTRSIDLEYLATGVNYELMVRSVCDSMLSSSYSDTLVFSTTSCPAPDTSFVSAISYRSARLHWTTVGAADEYEILLSPTGVERWQRFTTEDTTLFVPELEQGQHWQWMVSASCGDHGRSAVMVSDTFQTWACGEPDTLVVSNAGYTSAQLDWSVSDSAQSYVIEYRDNGLGLLSFWQSVNSADTTEALAGLEASKTYTVKVYAKCDSITYSSISKSYELETDECSQPTGFDVTAVGYRGFTAVWDSVSGVDGYTFRWRHRDSTDWVSGFTEDTFAVVGSLEPGESYALEVRSECDTAIDAWSLYAETFSLELPSCSVPSGLTLSAAGDDSLLVVWNEIASAQSYGLQWRGLGESSWNTEEVSDTSFAVLSLSSCAVYEFRVRSFCDTLDGVESDYSASYFATTTGTGCWNEPLPVAFEYDTLAPGWPTDAWSLNDLALPVETRWIDRYGHTRVEVDLSEETPDTCGAFKVYYADVIGSLTTGFADTVSITTHASGAETVGELRRNCLCKALADVQEVISDAEEMPEVYVRRSLDSGVGALASGSSFYDVTSEEAFQGGSVRELLIAGADSISGYDAWLRFDFGERQRDTITCELHANWYTHPGHDIDLYGVAQHQAYKLLGFASLFRPSGESLAGAATYSLLDRNWHYLDSSDTTFKPVLSSTGELNVAPNYVSTYYMAYLDAQDTLQHPMAHSYNGLFSGGTSLSVVNEFSEGEATGMLQALSKGQRNKPLSETELDVLCDLGYTVSVIGGGCGNRQPVAAVDYAYGDVSQPVSFNLLENDSDPDGDTLTLDSSFEPRIVRGTGLLSCQSDGSCTLTPAPGFVGVVEVVYRTHDGARSGGFGKGNVTYGVNKTAVASCQNCDATDLLVDRGGFDDAMPCSVNTNRWRSDLAPRLCPNQNPATTFGTYTLAAAFQTNPPNGPWMIPSPTNGWRYPLDNPTTGQPSNVFDMIRHNTVLLCDAGPVDPFTRPVMQSLTDYRYRLWYQVVFLAAGQYCYSAYVANPNQFGANLPSLFLAVSSLPNQTGVGVGSLYHTLGVPNPLGNFGVNANILGVRSDANAFIANMPFTASWNRLNTFFTVQQAGFYQLAIVLDNIPRGVNPPNPGYQQTRGGMDLIIDGITLHGPDDGSQQPPAPVSILATPAVTAPLCVSGQDRFIDLEIMVHPDMRGLPDGPDGEIDYIWNFNPTGNFSGVTLTPQFTAPLTSKRARLFIPAGTQGPGQLSVCARVRKRQRGGNPPLGCPRSALTCTTITFGNSPEINVTTTNPTCDQANGYITVQVTNPTGGQYVYSLDGTNTSPTTTNPWVWGPLAAGTYEVSVNVQSNSNFPCPAVRRVSLNNQPSTLTLSTTVTSACAGDGQPLGSIRAVVGSGTPNYTLRLLNSSNTQVGDPQTGSGTTYVFDNLPPGTYTIQAVDAAGCRTSRTVTVNSGGPTVVSSVAVGVSTCANRNGVRLQSQIIGGAHNVQERPFQFPPFIHLGYPQIIVETQAPNGTWSATTPVPIGLGQGFGWPIYSIIHSNLGPGTYRIRVVDLNGCTAFGLPVVIAEPADGPSVSLASAGCRTPTFGNVTLTATVTGGTAPLQYQWTSVLDPNTPADNDNEITVTPNLPGATYTVSVTDANSCTAQASILVQVPQVWARDRQGNYVNAGANGQNPFGVWFDASLQTGNPADACRFFLISENSDFVNNGVNANGYTYAIFAQGTEPTTEGDWRPLNFVDVPGYFYDRYGGAANQVGVPSGNHTLYVRTLEGCIEAVNFTIDADDPAPEMTVTQPSCADANGVISFQSAGLNVFANQENAQQYEFTIDGTTWLRIGNQGGPTWVDGQIVFANLVPGTYTVAYRLIASPDCGSASANVVLTVSSNTLVCGTVSNPLNVCLGNTVSIDNTGQVDGFLLNDINPANGNPVWSAPQDEGTLFTGGTGTLNYVIQVLSSPGGAGAPEDMLVIDGNGSLVFNPDDANPALVPMPAGVYSYLITATDQNGCERACTLNVNVNPRPIVSAVSESFNPNFPCNANQTGAILVTAFSADGQPLSYTLNSLFPSPLSGGTFNPWTRNGFAVPSVNRLRISNVVTGCRTMFLFEMGVGQTTQPNVVTDDPSCERAVPDGAITVSDPFALPAHLRGTPYQHNTFPDLQFRVVGPVTTAWTNGGQTGQVPFEELSAGNYNAQMRIVCNSSTATSMNRQVTLNNQTTISHAPPSPSTNAISVQNIGGGNDPYIITAFDGPITGSEVGTSDPILDIDPNGSVTVPSAGFYNIVITDDDGCRAVFLDAEANRQGEHGRSETASYRLYPNPTRGQVTVEFDAPAGAGQIFEAHDLAGRLIGRWNLDEGAQSLQIETAGWAEGLYACTLRHGKRTLFVSKLSVIR